MLQQQKKTVSCAFFLVAFLVFDASSVKADAFAYATVQTSVADNFGTLDLNTGAFSAINTSEPNQLELASYGGSLYAIVLDGTTLYQVNPATGALTTIGSLGLGAG